MPCAVLLVDDERHVIEALKRALHKESFEIHAAFSAQEALDILSHEKIDVVVSDEIMPGMLGSDLLGIVCAEYPETIRIMLTGHPNLNTALRAINNGHIYRFLVKPCSGQELGVVIKQALQHRELSRKSRSLLATVKRQNTILEGLEKRNPGITKVDRDTSGAICLPDVEYDVENLIHEINKEVKRSDSLLKASSESAGETSVRGGHKSLPT